MTVAVTEDGSLVTFGPKGPLDDELAEELRIRAVAALEAGRNRVVLNLQMVSHSSSTGLEVIVRLARSISDTGGRLALVGVNDSMADILRATRLDRRLAVFDSTEAALQTMTQGV